MIKKIWVLILFCLPLTALAQTDWRDLKTDHFIVFYKPGYEYQAWEALKALDHYGPQVRLLTGDTQPPLTAIVIQDAGNLTNGLTDPLNQTIQLFTDPPSASMGLPGENWWALVSTHEYTHLSHLNRSFGLPGLLTRIGGTLFNPNLELPSWADEGFAVYSESKVSPYSGRLNDGFNDAYLGAAALENRFPSLLKTTFVPLEYPTDVYYTAGAGFYKYLAATYGEEKFSKFYEDYGTNVLSYLSGIFPFVGLDAAAEKSFGGKSIPELWDDWQKEESAKSDGYQADGKALTKQGWDFEGLQVSQGRLYYEQSYPVKTGVYYWFLFNRIMERDLGTGREREWVSTTSYFTSPLRVHGDKLYYSVAEVREGYANTLNYGYYSLIHEKDLGTGCDRVLLESQLRAFEALPDGRLLVSEDKRDGFGSNLYSFNPATGAKKILFRSDLLVDEIAADKGRIVVTAQKHWGQFNLYLLNLKKGKSRRLIPSPFLERNPQLAGDKLFFNANFGKKYALYEYDFSTGKIFRLTATGYAAWPAYDEQGKNIYFAGLNSYGLDLYAKPYQPKRYVPTAAPESPAPVYTLDEKDVKKGGYLDDLAWLSPKALHLPLAYFDNDHSWLGFGIAGTDALYQYDYAVVPAWDFKNNRFGIDFAFSTQLFSPWVSAIEYSGIEDDTLFFQTVYPLVLRLSPGLSTIDLGVTGDYHDGFTRKELDPYMGVAFSYPTNRFSFLVTAAMERVYWGSNLDRTGAYGYLSYLQYLPGSHLLAAGIGIDDPECPDTVFPTLRGYGHELWGRKGMAASVDYSIPLLKVRWGLWNPSLYFQDIILDVFSDQAFDNNGATQWAYGAELHLETGLTNTGTSLPEDLGVRFAHTQEGANTVEGFFTFFAFNLANLDRAPAGNGAWLKPPAMPPLEQMGQALEKPRKPLF